MIKKLGLYRNLFIIFFAFSTVTLAKGKSTFNQSYYYITGTVTNNLNRPVPKVWVILFQGAIEKKRTLTGNDGKYYLGRLPAGTYKIIAQKQLNGIKLYNKQVSVTKNLPNYNIKIS